ncbi:helix-turn-helix domain-containing protein [Negadavirga shengliensis]|uniref:Helix-turn-helix domain-containing protein n=1 Tax=Negadavirga shengliensis TaxID=1389218 RepID=A0ABV9T8Z0_9BACT
MAFEAEAKAFATGELIKEERRLAGMTQEELAEKTGTKKSFISRIENGKTDIQLSTLYRILEMGFWKENIIDDRIKAPHNVTLDPAGGSE